MTLVGGRWSITSIRETGCVRKRPHLSCFGCPQPSLEAPGKRQGRRVRTLCHALPLRGCPHRAPGGASPSRPADLPWQQGEVRATNEPGWTDSPLRQYFFQCVPSENCNTQRSACFCKGAPTAALPGTEQLGFRGRTQAAAGSWDGSSGMEPRGPSCPGEPGASRPRGLRRGTLLGRSGEKQGPILPG